LFTSLDRTLLLDHTDIAYCTTKTHRKDYHTHTQPFYSPLWIFFWGYPSEMAPERLNHEGKTNLDLLKQEIMSGSGISWANLNLDPDT